MDDAPLVVALGGNALIRPGDRGGLAQQALRIAEVCPALVGLRGPGGLVLTHGNGPQVGWHLLRSELAVDQVPPEPLDAAVAATQGEIGWQLQLGLRQAMLDRGQDPRVVTLLTQVLVDPNDPAFEEPTKFVGGFYTGAQARQKAAELGWRVAHDGIRGWRRVVPSPLPLDILELELIGELARRGTVVVACGGGGIPVARVHGRLAGVEAVVDKDRSSSLLARRLGARTLIILTAVDRVMVDFGTPSARPLDRIPAAELRAHHAAGQFPAGSMGPKIEAALSFIEGGGHEVIITSPESLEGLKDGALATRVVR